MPRGRGRDEARATSLRPRTVTAARASGPRSVTWGHSAPGRARKKCPRAPKTPWGRERHPNAAPGERGAGRADRRASAPTHPWCGHRRTSSASIPRASRAGRPRAARPGVRSSERGRKRIGRSGRPRSSTTQPPSVAPPPACRRYPWGPRRTPRVAVSRANLARTLRDPRARAHAAARETAPWRRRARAADAEPTRAPRARWPRRTQRGRSTVSRGRPTRIRARARRWPGTPSGAGGSGLRIRAQAVAPRDLSARCGSSVRCGAARCGRARSTRAAAARSRRSGGRSSTTCRRSGRGARARRRAPSRTSA